MLSACPGEKSAGKGCRHGQRLLQHPLPPTPTQEEEKKKPPPTMQKEGKKKIFGPPLPEGR
jgi:hypothetical protein